MLSAYFRDVAHKCTMLGLLQERDVIQVQSREELRRRFHEFDIECVDVLIGKPDTAEAGGKIETLARAAPAAPALDRADRDLPAPGRRRRQAPDPARGPGAGDDADPVDQLGWSTSGSPRTRARPRSRGRRKQAEQLVVTAEAESQQRVLAGRGEGSRILQVGLSEASILLRKIQSYSDPRLYALALVAEHMSNSSQPLVPERVFTAGGGVSGTGSDGLAANAGSGRSRPAHQPHGRREVGLSAFRERRHVPTPGVRRQDGPAGDGVDGTGQPTSPLRRQDRRLGTDAEKGRRCLNGPR